MTPEVTSLKMIKFVIFTVFANSVCILCAKSPVLIWSSSRPLSDLPQSYAGETLSGETFNKAFLEPLTSNGDHSLVVFMQDKLSVEDFTNHADVYNPNSDGGAFKNVKSALDDQFSVHLPAVSDTKASIEAISSSFPGELVKVANPDDFGKLNLEDGKSYLIIVDLEPIQQQEEYGSFKRNDEAIGQCLRHLNKRGVKYSAIYTAESSSKVQEESRQGRHLLETGTAAAGESHNGTFVSYNGLMLFLNNITVTVTVTEGDQGKTESLSGVYLFKNESQAVITYENETYSVTLNFDEPGNGTAEIYMEIYPTNQFEFESKNGNFTWTPHGNEKYSVDKMPMDYKVQATMGFCYHCTILRAQPVLKDINTTDLKTRKISLVLHSFQVEAHNPWNNSTLRFSDNVWDCVEFFTIPIWMGLFTTVVLMIILFFGVTMISRITTMDRFDDPKGKTITVTVNE